MPGPTPSVITLRDDSGLQLQLLDIGATWWSLQVPVPGEPVPREVLLGGPTPLAHLGNTAYLGATVGRVANRIAHGDLQRDGQRWSLQCQPGSPHQLHGGPDGYDRRPWQVIRQDARSVCFELVSPAGDQGFPGALRMQTTVRLTGQGCIEQTFEATCDAPTPVGLTNHAYFNLDGRDSDVRGHTLQIHAGRYTPVDDALIPLGPLAPVADTGFDFRRPRFVGSPGRSGPHGGVIDHGFLLDPACAGMARPAVELTAGDGRLTLALSTTMPALQLYTGELLEGQPGRHAPCRAFGGLALEPQWLPDSVHHPEWPQPDCWLAPGQTWRHGIRFEFVALASPDHAA